MVGLQYLFLEPNADDPLNKGLFRSLYMKPLNSQFVLYRGCLGDEQEQGAVFAEC